MQLFPYLVRKQRDLLEVASNLGMTRVQNLTLAHSGCVALDVTRPIELLVSLFLGNYYLSYRVHYKH